MNLNFVKIIKKSDLMNAIRIKQALIHQKNVNLRVIFIIFLKFLLLTIQIKLKEVDLLKNKLKRYLISKALFPKVNKMLKRGTTNEDNLLFNVGDLKKFLL